MSYSTSIENHLKAIFHLQQQQPQVSTNALAAALQTKPASITDMMKKLHQLKLVQYEPYQGVMLTAEGKKQAIRIIRKHRLWEYFLVAKLGMTWDEVHEIAEELEHIQSEKLIDRLDDYLQHPKFDPHGDPIPDKEGKMNKPQLTMLSRAPHQTGLMLKAVTSHHPDLLALLERYQIALGSYLLVKEKFAFDQSLTIELADASTIQLSESVSKQLQVQIVQPK